MSKLKLAKVDFTAVETPAAGKVVMGVDSTDGLLKMKIETGEVIPIGAGGGDTWIDAVRIRAKATEDEGGKSYNDVVRVAPDLGIEKTDGAITGYNTILHNYSAAQIEIRTFGADGVVTDTYIISDSDLRSMMGVDSISGLFPAAVVKTVDDKAEAVFRFAFLLNAIIGGKNVYRNVCMHYIIATGDLVNVGSYDTSIEPRGIHSVVRAAQALAYFQNNENDTYVYYVAGWNDAIVTKVGMSSIDFDKVSPDTAYQMLSKSESEDILYVLMGDSGKGINHLYSYDFSSGMKTPPTAHLTFEWGEKRTGKPIRMALCDAGLYLVCEDVSSDYAQMCYFVTLKEDGSLNAATALPLAGFTGSSSK